MVSFSIPKNGGRAIFALPFLSMLIFKFLPKKLNYIS